MKLLQSARRLMGFETKTVNLGDALFSRSAISLPVAQLMSSSFIKAYGQVGWLFAVVSKIAASVAETEWHVYQVEANGERKELPGHPLMELLDRVSPMLTGLELMESTDQMMSLVGEHFWVKVRGGGRRVAELQPIHPFRMSVVPHPVEYIAGYVYHIEGRQIPLERDDVIHFKMPNPETQYRGMGPVQSIINDLDAERLSAVWNRAFFYNSAEPGGVIEVQDTLGDKEYNRLREQWNEKHRGANAAHQVAILEGGATWKSKAMSQKEMDFPGLKQVSRDVILGAFGIPLHILGIAENVNRANAEAAEFTFARWVVRPRLRRIRAKLQEQLVPEFSTDSRLILDFDDPVPDNNEYKLNLAERSWNGRWARLNEVRTLTGFDPIDGPEGDEFKKDPLSDLLGTPPPSGDEDDEDEKSIRLLVGTDGKVGIIAQNGHQPKALPAAKEPELEFTEDQEVRWRGFVEEVEPMEKKHERWLRAFFAEQEKAVLEALDDSLKLLKGNPQGAWVAKIEAEEIFDMERWRRAAAAGSQPIHTEALRRAALKFALQYGFDFNMENPSVLRWIGERMERFSVTINNTTIDSIRAQLREGARLGEGIPQLTARVQEVFEQASRARATTIARTEMVSASNQGNLEAAVQSGVVNGKRWLAALDERVRETHADAHRRYQQPIGLHEEFKVGLDSMQVPGQGILPGENINCRCTWVEVVDDTALMGRGLQDLKCPECNALLGRKLQGVKASVELYCRKCKATRTVSNGINRKH